MLEVEKESQMAMSSGQDKNKTFKDLGIEILTQDGEEGLNVGELTDFEKLLTENLKVEKSVKSGSVVQGKVVKVQASGVLVDIGYKSESFIPSHEFLSPTGEVNISEGDEIEVYVENVEDDHGLIQLSKQKADLIRVWDKIAIACQEDQLIEGTVVGKVKGGLAVDIGVKAFLPGSQIDVRPVKNVDHLIGTTMSFKVIKFNKKRGNIVLSRKAIVEVDRKELQEKLEALVSKGEVIEGTVKNVTDYGIFVDLGGMDGLVHITDLSWGRIKHPSELYKSGDVIKAKVLKYDSEKQRISLGVKQIQADPWKENIDKYKVGDRVKGKVLALADYGVFVELESGIEGLVHVSEMSWTQKIKHPSQVVEEGQDVEAAILEIDSENRRMSLGLKQVLENPWEGLEAKYPIGARLRTKITNVTDFGIFVKIEKDVDGLVHVSDLSWTGDSREIIKNFKEGDDIEAVVLSIDPDNHKFSLGIKQTEESPWDHFRKEYFVGSQVEGTVTKIADFGVFMQLVPGVEGLVHISELSHERIEHPKKFCKEGDQLKAEIRSIDDESHKISLSVKALSGDLDS
jgi:small subunit ribosomal protein S1